MSHPFTFTKSNWVITEDKKVCETPIFSLHEVGIRRPPEKTTSPFYILKAPEWINVIALTGDNEIVLVEQYRAGIHKPTLEIPGGMTDPNEQPQDTAKRELMEETGFRSNKWTLLGRVSSNPAIMSNYTHLYLAEDCVKAGPQQTDSTEDISVHILPLHQFLNLVKQGTIHHALVVAAAAHLLMHLSPEDS